MSIIKDQLDGVISNSFYSGDTDILLANLQHLLSRPVPPDLGGGRKDTQVFARQFKTLAIIETDLKHPPLAVQFDLCRYRCHRNYRI